MFPLKVLNKGRDTIILSFKVVSLFHHATGNKKGRRLRETTNITIYQNAANKVSPIFYKIKMVAPW